MQAQMVSGRPLNVTLWEKEGQDSVVIMEVVFLVVNCVVLLLTSIVGAAANLFVVWAVCHQKSLQTWNNATLVNLAVVDALRCTVDCPVLLAVLTGSTPYHRRRRREELLWICDLQAVAFSLGCCVQLLTLACIGAERYQAIAHPFKSPQTRRRRAAVSIPLIWISAAAMAVACHLTFVKDSPVYVKCSGRTTTHSHDTFGLYILGPLWMACFVSITGFYAAIFAIVRAHSRKIFDKGSVPVPSRKEKTKEEEVTMTGGQEQKGNEDKGGQEKGQSETEQNQSQRQQAAAQVAQEPLIQAEPNPSNKNSLIVIPGSTKPPESKIELGLRTESIQGKGKKDPPPPPLPRVQRGEPNQTKVIKGRVRNTAGDRDTDDTQAQVKAEAAPPTFPEAEEQAVPLVNRVEPCGAPSPRKDLASVYPLRGNDNTDVTAKPRDISTDGGAKTTRVRSKSSREDDDDNKNNNKPLEVVLRTRVNETQQSSFVKTSGDGRDQSKPKDRTRVLRVDPVPRPPPPRAPQTEPKKSSNQLLSAVSDLRSSPGVASEEVQRISRQESEGDKTLRCVDKDPPRDTQRSCPERSDAQRSPLTLIRATETIKGRDHDDDNAVKDDQHRVFAQQAAELVDRPGVEVTDAGVGAGGAADADGAVCMMPALGNKERVVKNKEGKTAKRSAYIVFTFLLFWLPLITTILVNSVGHHNTRSELWLNMEVLSVSVACMSSLSDPIIYAAVNPQFRTEFYRLRNKWRALHKR